jgi:protein phosphatase 1 regulatory subunit 21
MEEDKNSPKYAKLLAEYSKLRTQAKVLKNAVVEERNKVSVLEESLRIKDQNLRRTESEIDSINFRNKQLEHRVSSLQDDLQNLNKSKGGANKSNKSNPSIGINQIDPIIFEDFQKKIIECAQLSSTISDKNNEIEMYINRIKDLELHVSKLSNNHSETEKKLRREIEVLSSKNTELETKIIEATSQLGSEGDSTSLKSDSTMPISNLLASTNHTDDRIAFLEKELNHYRTQYELLKINDALRMDEHLISQSNQLQNMNSINNCNQTTSTTRKVLSSQSSTSSSMSNNNHSTFVNYPTSSQSSGSKSSPCQTKGLPETTKCDDDQEIVMNRDQVVYEHFSKRFEELFQEKSRAESKVINYMTECETLKNNIELLAEEIEEKDKSIVDYKASYIRLEEDFLTTRVNYEEQICVLTDQVINLSDQLASR